MNFEKPLKITSSHVFNISVDLLISRTIYHCYNIIITNADSVAEILRNVLINDDVASAIAGFAPITSQRKNPDSMQENSPKMSKRAVEQLGRGPFEISRKYRPFSSRSIFISLPHPLSSPASLATRRKAASAAASLLVAVRHAAKLFQVSRRRLLPRQWLRFPRASGSTTSARTSGGTRGGNVIASSRMQWTRLRRRRRLVSLGVEAALDEGGGIADVVAVRFEDETLDAQPLILQNPGRP